MRIYFVLPFVVLSGCMQMATIESSQRVALSASQIAEIKSEVTSDFLDPASAQFKDIRAVDVQLAGGSTERRVCGEVNGKNAYGGYVGFSMFGGEIVNGDFRQRDFFSPCENW